LPCCIFGHQKPVIVADLQARQNRRRGEHRCGAWSARQQEDPLERLKRESHGIVTASLPQPSGTDKPPGLQFQLQKNSSRLERSWSGRCAPLPADSWFTRCLDERLGSPNQPIAK
jgi:hypothetical protein